MDREKVIKGWECHMEADTLKCADCPYREGWRTCNFADTLFKDVYALLKEQEAETGHWIDSAGNDKCSICGTEYSDLYPDYGNTHFCPNCGAKMEGR